MPSRAEQLITELGLKLHPEGGFYAEVHRSQLRVTRGSRPADRSALTAIYSLLPKGSVSRWHRVSSDEVWSYIEGDELDLVTYDPNLEVLAALRLGPVASGVRPLHVVPAGIWQGARTRGAYTLSSCSVGPGFEFADFDIAGDHPGDAALLRRVAPEWIDLI